MNSLSTPSYPAPSSSTAFSSLRRAATKFTRRREPTTPTPLATIEEEDVVRTESSLKRGKRRGDEEGGDGKKGRKEEERRDEEEDAALYAPLLVYPYHSPDGTGFVSNRSSYTSDNSTYNPRPLPTPPNLNQPTAQALSSSPTNFELLKEATLALRIPTSPLFTSDEFFNFGRERSPFPSMDQSYDPRLPNLPSSSPDPLFRHPFYFSPLRFSTSTIHPVESHRRKVLLRTQLFLHTELDRDEENDAPQAPIDDKHGSLFKDDLPSTIVPPYPIRGLASTLVERWEEAEGRNGEYMLGDENRAWLDDFLEKEAVDEVVETLNPFEGVLVEGGHDEWRE